MTYLPYLLATAGADLLAGGYDAYETIIGLRKGVAVEANPIINFLSGSLKTQRPSPVAIIGYNVLRTAAFLGLGFTGNPALIGGAFGGLIVGVIQHIQGARKWAYLLTGGKIDPNKSYSAWQKFLGLDWN